MIATRQELPPCTLLVGRGAGFAHGRTIGNAILRPDSTEPYPLGVALVHESLGRMAGSKRDDPGQGMDAVFRTAKGGGSATQEAGHAR
jgi:hypothetical protein